MRENDSDFQPDEFGCELTEAFTATLGPAILNPNIAALGPAQLMQTVDKGGGPLALCSGRIRAHESNHRHR